MPRLAYLNILCQDLESLSAFYEELFGFAEIETHRSPIYRCLDAGGFELGFNASLARQLLDMGEADHEMPNNRNLFPTFEVEDENDIDRLTSKAMELGGMTIKRAYDTYYNARQCVLADPEGNVFRLNFRRGHRLPAALVENPPWTA